jgi:aspartate/glutamate racemase
MAPISNPLVFFSEYMRLTGVSHLGPEKSGEPGLIGKRLGLINGSSWITAWSNYFGRLYLPGVQLVNIGNEAIQLNFMKAHAEGKVCPPQANIDRFVRYAMDLVELGEVDAVLITCSTMNRSFPVVKRALEPYHIPVIQIDMPMMEEAVTRGGKVLVIATHGPTVASTQALLEETAARMEKSIAYDGANVEKAWHCLAEGDIQGHNQALAEVIASRSTEGFSCVVLAQLSMSVFLLSYPDPVAEFGLPVLTSGQCGFESVRKTLLNITN